MNGMLNVFDEIFKNELNHRGYNQGGGRRQEHLMGVLILMRTTLVIRMRVGFTEGKFVRMGMFIVLMGMRNFNFDLRLKIAEGRRLSQAHDAE